MGLADQVPARVRVIVDVARVGVEDGNGVGPGNVVEVAVQVWWLPWWWAVAAAVADCCLLLPVGQLLVLSNGHLNATTTKLITITRCIGTTTRTLSTTTTIAVTVKRLRPLLSSRQRTRIEPNRDSSCLPFYLLPLSPLPPLVSQSVKRQPAVSCSNITRKRLLN